MFIAMNRFRVKKGSEDAFEKVWLGRDSYLDRIPGFLEFHLLRGPEAEDHTLYFSHAVWQSKRAFEAWTKSEEFRAAHARAGNETTGPLYLEHPKLKASKYARPSLERRRARELTADQVRGFHQFKNRQGTQFNGAANATRPRRRSKKHRS